MSNGQPQHFVDRKQESELAALNEAKDSSFVTWKHVIALEAVVLIPLMALFYAAVPSKNTVQSIEQNITAMGERMDVALDKIYANEADRERIVANQNINRRDIDNIFATMQQLVKALNDLTIELRTKGIPKQ